ncbi:hypothetical protein MPL1032_100078 [Mesorhizobium plurifarium]|uniref:Uncharacterized protein n=1 Tax=Mesorhizobium plurifarium TaxID=69974 RepID=A0A0K2VNY0_MESPL|nr:hypothetical protein MPL1032_100078 [Mesorhizobium plurifarium]
MNTFGGLPSHRHWPSRTPMYVVIGAEHCRRQLSQWQTTQACAGPSTSKAIVPHKQRPRMRNLLEAATTAQTSAARTRESPRNAPDWRLIPTFGAGDSERLR